MADEKKSSGKSKALTQLEKDVYETFGMLPNEDRLSLLPRYKKGEGFIAPEMLYELAKAVQSPRTAMYSELGPEEAFNMGLNVMGGSSVASAPRGALQMGMGKPTLDPQRRAALMDAERALPLNLPRAPAKSKQEIAAHAERVGRQMLGEHVRSGKPKDTQNLAGRSMKESQRLQNLQYELEPLKELPPIATVQPRIGDVNVAVPGDTSISDILLKSIEGEPIGSVQQGGSLYGRGKLDRDDPLFWASNEVPAQQMQDKITDVAALFEPDRVLAQHLAMGRVANHFAQHFADASLRAIDYSRLSAKDMNTFDNVIAGGYTKKNPKTGEVQYITFPHWPGIADPEAALAAMKADPEMRKWFLSRMKTPKLTQATNMPNALDIEWAITHPELRNMEVNLTGHSVGEMVPGAKLADDPDHETYLKGIRGTFLGQQENLTPFAISYPDATQHIASTQRPQDFTGTIQKVFPHQRVDQQYIDEYYEYMRQLQKILTGRKKGGAVKKAEGGAASLTDLPDEVTPANWREHLQNNVLADARALLGVKDGGVINLDELIEKSLKKKDGGVINLDELIDWTLAKAEHRKMKEGGAVKMADGGQTFPLQRPEEVTDLKPRPRTKRDELLEMLSKGVGSVHEFMAKPFGYENPPGEMVSSLIGLPGAAKTLERMAYGDPLTSGAGMTTNLLPETTEAAMLALGAAPTVLKATKNLPVGLSIKPTDMLDIELASKMKADKVKAPANPVGFYNPAEKAALNLQRKKGPGSAFISDMKKQPGVTDERLAELGLTDLASNPNLTREEVIAATEQNRIPLRESVRRPYQESDEYSETADALKESIRYREGGIQQVQAELDRVRATAPDSPLVQQYERKIETMRESIARDQQKLEAAKPSLYGPDSHPDYNMPGGENYREIRVGLPNTQRKKEIHEWVDPKTQTSKQFATQEEAIADKGKPASAYIMKRYEMEGAEPFYHKQHHGDEPNVLFHLRVADHVDEEGKRGLLIDELQSDWHQAGRDKGYKSEAKKEYFRQIELEKKFDNKTITEQEQSELENLVRRRAAVPLTNRVPDAPFKDNWYQLGLKRAIKEASDTGMDRVYLTTGARQADRYDLSKKVEAITATKGSDQVHIQVALDGVNSKSLGNFPLEGNALDEAVGKELAEKIRAQSGIGSLHRKRYEGVDLKVGGEGMKQYYDKNYKNYLEKYAKQHGGKLGMTKLEIGGEQNNWPAFRDWFAAKYPPGSARGGSGTALYQWEEGANNRFVKEFTKGLEKNYEPVYYIDITDAMRESAKKGQSYAFGGGVFNTDPDITDSGRIIPHNI